MKAAVAIDKWKLQIFKKWLSRAGYVFVQKPGPTDDTLMLSVDYDDEDALKKVITAANGECARSRMD